MKERGREVSLANKNSEEANGYKKNLALIEVVFFYNLFKTEARED